MARVAELLGPALPNLGLPLGLALETPWTPWPRGAPEARSMPFLKVSQILVLKGDRVLMEKRWVDPQTQPVVSFPEQWRSPPGQGFLLSSDAVSLKGSHGFVLVCFCFLTEGTCWDQSWKELSFLGDLSPLHCSPPSPSPVSSLSFPLPQPFFFFFTPFIFPLALIEFWHDKAKMLPEESGPEVTNSDLLGGQHFT